MAERAEDTAYRAVENAAAADRFSSEEGSVDIYENHLVMENTDNAKLLHSLEELRIAKVAGAP